MIEGDTVLLGGDVVLEVAGVPIFDEEPSPKARTLEAADRAPDRLGRATEPLSSQRVRNRGRAAARAAWLVR